MNSILEEFIFYSREAKTVDVLFSLYKNSLYKCGFDHTACAITSDHSGLDLGNSLGIIRVNDFNGWDQHYYENNYIAIDPTPKLTSLQPGIFCWDTIEKQQPLTAAQSNIFVEAENFNLFNGHTFSVHGPNGTKFSTLAASSQRSSPCAQYTIDMVNMMSQQFYVCFSLLMKHRIDAHTINLTRKEIEILKWTAKGLTKADISDRINVSTHTVDYHTRNILKKLDSKNIAMALAIAISKGLIAI